MDRQIQILILDDEASDAALVERELRKAGIDFRAKCVQDKRAFLQALDDFTPDLVLSDYSLPGFDGLSALALVRQRFPDIPVIIVSGAIGEEVAIETLKSGATDYVLKERLGRLGQVVRRALKEAEQLAESRRFQQALIESEEALKESYDALERRVHERTAELLEVNKDLATEIADRERAEKALGESELRYRSLALATTEIVWTTNAGGEVDDDMPYWREFTGQSVEQIKGWGWSNALHPDDMDRVKAVWSESVRAQRLYEIEYRLLRRDGQYRDVSVRGVPVLEKDGRISEWIGTCVDITDRKRMEEELRKASLYARSLIEASLDPMVTISPLGQITDVNKATEAVTGVVRENLIGNDFSACFTDPRKADEGYHKVLTEGSVTDYPLTIRHASGRTTDVLYNATVYRDEAGQVQGIFAAARDVTEHNRMDKELQALHQALERRADQLRRLASELTLTEHRERHRLALVLHDHLQQLLYAARLSITTIKRQVSDKDLHNLIQALDALLSQCIDESRSVTTELSPPVLYDGGLIQALEWLSRQMQLTHGLLVDVQAEVQAEPEGEDIKVLLFQSVRELLFNVVKHAGAHSAQVNMSLTPDGLARIDVADEGAGFDAEQVITNGNHVAGFGLFSIRERLEYMGGRMEMHTAMGKGTRISIFAPCRLQEPSVEPLEAVQQSSGETQSADSKPELSATNLAGSRRPRRIRVLLADDHTVLRKGLVGVLNQEPDIEVVAEAADGEMAVELAKQYNPDVVLMDVTMPKVDGIEATRRIAGTQLGVRVIGYSAHKEEDMARALYKAGAIGYLSKDEPAEFLIAAIRNVPLRAEPGNGHSRRGN